MSDLNVTQEEWDKFTGEDYYDTVMRVKRVEEQLDRLDKQVAEIAQIRKDLVELELKISDIALFIKQIKAARN